MSARAMPRPYSPHAPDKDTRRSRRVAKTFNIYRAVAFSGGRASSENRLISCRCGPLAEFGPALTSALTPAKNWAMFPKSWKYSTKLGQGCPALGENASANITYDPKWSVWAKHGRYLAKLGQSWTNLVRLGPTLANMLPQQECGPKVARIGRPFENTWLPEHLFGQLLDTSRTTSQLAGIAGIARGNCSGRVPIRSISGQCILVGVIGPFRAADITPLAVLSGRRPSRGSPVVGPWCRWLSKGRPDTCAHGSHVEPKLGAHMVHRRGAGQGLLVNGGRPLLMHPEAGG